MKKVAIFAIVLLMAIAGFAETLTIYTYSSFVSGIGNEIKPIFEKMYDCKINFVSMSSGSLVARLILEKSNPKADVVIGLSQSQIPEVLDQNLLIPYKPTNIASVVNKSFLIDPLYRVIPFDYGALAIDYSKSLKNPPKTFDDLLSSQYSHTLVIEDPRTSTTGLDFLLWTIAIYGDKWQDYWQKLMPTIKTVTSGWDTAFQMLENGEAKMMVSFATDEAYNYYYYKGSDIGVVIPNDEAYVMVEYAGIVKGTKHLSLAQKFIDFVLSKDFQSAVPLNQWMYPVTDVSLPQVFIEHAPVITKTVTIPMGEIKTSLSKWINEWTQIIIK
ncbi:thiamine ABC transporter substrate-binding protein [Athalassotoga sp.]|uniref:thiamine ABC transporter substrate-binding protein n=1 Tax=Athalassotoga sp. TaxID=2022597 RepID=UPI003D01DEDC